MLSLLNQLPSDPGTYALILQLQHPEAIRAGSLGIFQLVPGFYIYLGSAFGPGGVRSRLKHHLSPVRSPHWHIDYLRQSAQVIDIIYTCDAESLEHAWAAELISDPKFSIPIPRFGASDCRCASHLFYSFARACLEDSRFVGTGQVGLTCIRNTLEPWLDLQAQSRSGERP